MKMYTAARKYIDNNYRTYWDQYFRVYKRQRVNRHYEGISDPIIPEAFTIIETLVSNIAGGNISFHFRRTNEEQTTQTDVLNSLLDYYLECNDMGLRNQEWVRDMLLYGTGILHITWVNGKPKIDNCALRDFFVNPEATSAKDWRYAGMVYLGNIEVMKKAQIYDEKQDKWVPKYTGLDDIGVTPTGTADGNVKVTDKQFKDQFQGSTLGTDAPIKQIFVVLIYDLDSGKVFEIGNQKQIIYQDDIPYQRAEQTRMVQVTGPNGQTVQVQQKLDAIEPFIPFAVLRDYIDSSQFFGEGEMAIIADRQEMLNDLESMDTDNLAYQNTPMYQIDPQFADLAPEIETIPGAVYPIPKGAISSLPIAEIAGNLDAKKDRVMESMRRATAADETIQGVAQDQGRITATEVSSTITQAQNRFSTKINNLQNEGYAQLAMILFKMTQIFVSNEIAVRIVGPMGTTFEDYNPWDYNGEWEPHATLDITEKQKQLEVGQKLNQIYLNMKDSPVYDPVAVQRWLLKHLDPTMTDDEFNALLAKTPPGPSNEQLKTQADVQQAELQAVAQIYPKATPFVQAQIEKILGMQPDPMHEAAEQHAQMQMGAEQADLFNPHTQADGKPDPMIPPAPTPAPQPAGMAA